jgi:nucleotide-binding universal stress UspA family protein
VKSRSLRCSLAFTHLPELDALVHKLLTFKENAMADLRSLLVHFDASSQSLARLRLAHAWAKSNKDAAVQVTALYATVPLALRLGYDLLGGGTASTFSMLSALDVERRDAARQLFERERGDDGLLRWADLGNEPLVTGFATCAFCSDLMVLGQHNPESVTDTGVAADFVPSVLLDSGKPGLIVPCSGDFDHLGDKVLVAWKYTRESARAVASALSILRRAKRVDLALPSDAQGVSHAGLDVFAWFRAQGIEVQVHRDAVDNHSPGEDLLSLASDVNADLLVMGCYGRSRMREWIMGGVSRTVLGSMTLPVWMAH